MDKWESVSHVSWHIVVLYICLLKLWASLRGSYVRLFRLRE